MHKVHFQRYFSCIVIPNFYKSNIITLLVSKISKLYGDWWIALYVRAVEVKLFRLKIWTNNLWFFCIRSLTSCKYVTILNSLTNLTQEFPRIKCPLGSIWFNLFFQMLNYKIVKNSLILSWISERMKTFPYYKNSFEVFGPIRPDMVRCHLSQKGSGQGDKCA